MRVRRSTYRRRSGITAMELVTVAPLAFFFFFAAFEFGRVAMIRHTADNAVYEAARQATIPGGAANQARQEARRMFAAVGVDHFNIKVRPANIEADTAEVTVGVRVPLNGNSFVPPQFLGGRFIERELTLRREGM